MWPDQFIPAPVPLRVGVAFSLSLLMGGSIAQATPMGDLLTLLRQSPGWRAADLTYQKAQLTLDGARARAGLSISLGADTTSTELPGGDWATSGALNVSATWSVLPWSSAQEAVRKAERALQIASVELRSTRADLTLQALQAYVAVKQAMASRDLTEEQVQVAQKALVAARAQRAEQVITQEALLQRQGVFDAAQADALDAQRTMLMSAQKLAQLLGRPLTLSPDAAAYPGLPELPVSMNEAELLQLGLSRRVEIIRAFSSVLDAQTALDAAQRTVVTPDLTLSTKVGQLSDGQGGSGQVLTTSLNLKSGVMTSQFRQPLKETGALPGGISISLTGSFPLVDRSQNITLQEARVNLAQAQLALDTARQALVLEVRTHLMEYRNAQGGLPALQTAADGAQVNFESSRARLAAGLGTVLEVDQARLNLHQAQARLSNQRDAINLAAFQLAKSTGNVDRLLNSPF